MMSFKKQFRIFLLSILVFAFGQTALAGEPAAKNGSDCDTKTLQDLECSINGLSKNPSVKAEELPRGFVQNCFIKPCVLSGDFDGDGKADRAVLVADSKLQRKGIAVLFAKGKKTVIGAGNKFSLAGDDFAWMTAWSVMPKSGSSKVEAISLGKAEAGAGLASWQDGRFKWTQRPL